MRTAEEVRQHFKTIGVPISQWAAENGYTANKVYRVISGVEKGYYGQAHEIAVRLGLKPHMSDS
jgi:gp16 family phage-associated protein